MEALADTFPDRRTSPPPDGFVREGGGPGGAQYLTWSLGGTVWATMEWYHPVRRERIPSLLGSWSEGDPIPAADLAAASRHIEAMVPVEEVMSS